MSNFDFTAINNATNNLSPGMKLAVAQGLLTSATKAFEAFKRDEDAAVVLGIGEALKTFRIHLKAQYEEKQATNDLTK